MVKHNTQPTLFGAYVRFPIRPKKRQLVSRYVAFFLVGRNLDEIKTEKVWFKLVSFQDEHHAHHTDSPKIPKFEPDFSPKVCMKATWESAKIFTTRQTCDYG